MLFDSHSKSIKQWIPHCVAVSMKRAIVSVVVSGSFCSSFDIFEFEIREWIIIGEKLVQTSYLHETVWCSIRIHNSQFTAIDASR